MILTIADQYLAQNAGRRYPLADDTEGVPNNAILDFHCTARLYASGAVVRATLDRIKAVSGGKKLEVNVRNGNAVIATLSFEIPATVSTKTPYTVLATNADTVGEMTVTAAVLSAPDGENLGIPFATTTVVCDSMRVDSVQSAESVEPLPSYTALLSGDIVLAQGYNADPYLDGNTVRVDIVKGGGIGEYCQTASSGQTCDNVMFSINGEKPGSDGDIRIVGESGIIVTPIPEENAVEIRLDTVAEDNLINKCDTVC